MRKVIIRGAAVLAMVLLSLGLDVGVAQASPPAPTAAAQLQIGPIEVCKVVTFFDIVIFEYDCYTV